MSFKALLKHWESNPRPAVTEHEFSMRLSLQDAARVLALADMYGMKQEEIVADLLRTALDEVAEAMPYVPGTKVIREDEYGDPVYEDQGPMPRFLELTRSKHAELVARQRRR